jgi:hypothetical protein
MRTDPEFCPPDGGHHRQRARDAKWAHHISMSLCLFAFVATIQTGYDVASLDERVSTPSSIVQSEAISPSAKTVQLRTLITRGMQDMDVHQLLGETVETSGLALSYTEFYEQYDLAITYDEHGEVMFIHAISCE